MIRYSFQKQIEPPAPFVNLVLRNPVTGVEQRDVPAQVDTAADRTVIPESLVTALELPRVGAMRLGGFGGAEFTLPVHAVLLGVHDRSPQPFKVAAHANEQWVLLGRDVLNQIRIVLDGPQLILEIE